MLGLSAACVAAAVVVVVLAASGSSRPVGDDGPTRAAVLPATPYVVFRDLDRDHPENYGRVGVLPLDDLSGRRELPGIACDRVDFSGTRGICLRVADRFPLRYEATILDARMRPVRSLRVTGIPSRARVSADGRWGTTTTFVSGDSYADLGVFSTRATIIDMRTGTKVVDNLEDLPVTRDGRRMESIDHNLWGVTFAADDDTFYATLATGGRTYLVRGSISGRTLEAIHENVECPSLSPDGTRIAYKKRTGSRGIWRLAVLDLATMRETLLAEPDPVDDQAEWLDDDTVLYRDGETVSAVPADGSGAPREFLPAADSPSVVRPAS